MPPEPTYYERFRVLLAEADSIASRLEEMPSEGARSAAALLMATTCDKMSDLTNEYIRRLRNAGAASP
jgi:hypothetical protein